MKIRNRIVYRLLSKLYGIARIFLSPRLRNLFHYRVYLKIFSPSLYPIQIPDIKVQPDLDFLLLELPPRFMSMMPNGLGYVHNLLKTCQINFQTIDVNIILYHRFYSEKILKKGKVVNIPSSPGLGDDPWTYSPERHDFSDFFWPQMEDILRQIERQRPKVLGISLNGLNRQLASRFIQSLKSRRPDILVVVGGYACVHPQPSTLRSQGYDYMVVGECEMVLKPLVQAIVRGERPKDLPGIFSRFDSPERVFEPAALPENLDEVTFPKYEWLPHFYYQTHDCQHLVPITASRGCPWGKCRFCLDCFPFRKRKPASVVDEIEWWVGLGFTVFYFNDNDVNGDQQNLSDICSEIIKRKLRVTLFGQLRVDRFNSREYFQHLSRAGFSGLIFGVDGWSQNTLKLQCKGYTMAQVYQNLKDCHAAGIYTGVNIVVGVPGETEEDIDESIRHITNLRPSIDEVEKMYILNLVVPSEYLRNSEKYKIRFKGKKEDVVAQHPNYIPGDLWYSEDPFIDHDIRCRRMNKIFSELSRNGVNIGGFARKGFEWWIRPFIGRRY